MEQPNTTKGLAMPDLENPYRSSYFPQSILKGLKFYFNLLDKISIDIYTNPKLPLKRKDILLTISYLESIPTDSNINNLSHSHPQLTWAMESIEGLSELSEVDLIKHDTRIMSFLEELLSSGINTMVQDAKTRIPQSITKLSIEEKIEYLIENKYYLSQNEGSFPSKYIKEIVSYCNGLVEKYKELKESKEGVSVNSEIRKMVEEYLSLLNNNINSNDLISPLLARDYEEFTMKLKRMLYIPSYFDIKEEDRERTFHIYLLGVLQGKLIGYNLHSNKESGLGRYDIAFHPIDTSNPAVLVEIKKIGKSDNVEEELSRALKQISQKQYSVEIKRLGIKNILNIGIVFNGLEPHLKYESQ